MKKKLTPEEEAITKEQKERAKELAEANKLRDERTKADCLKPYNEFLADPLAKIKFLCEQGDFSSNYSKRMELFNLMTQIQIQQSLKELVSVLKSRK
ncbi:hypothetical protein ES703_14266 [subsurface metagenome]